MDTGKSQERQNNLYAIRIINSPIILLITENGTHFYPVSRYDGFGKQKKEWAKNLKQV